MQQDGTFRQLESSWWVYPGSGWRRFAFRAPVTLWRLGLGPLLPNELLLLTTIGRKSGRIRRTTLEYSYFNGCYFLASGWGKRADWLQNALINPWVTVQTARRGTVYGKACPVVEADDFKLLYQSAHGKSPVWKAFLESFGIEDNLTDFLAKKDRLQVLQVTPVEIAYLPPLRADLSWVWLLLGVVLGGALWRRGKRR